MHNKTADI